MYEHIQLIRVALDALLASRVNDCIALDGDRVLEVVPHYWREEAPTIHEWFCRTCRGLGLNAVYCPDANRYLLRLQRAVIREKCLTRNQNPGPSPASA